MLLTGTLHCGYYHSSVDNKKVESDPCLWYHRSSTLARVG